MFSMGHERYYRRAKFIPSATLIEFQQRAYFVEKLALISAVFADSVSLLIWEIDCDDGTTSGSAGGSVL